MVGCWVACTFRGLASSIEDPQKYGFYYPYCATHRTHRGVKLLAAHPSCPYTVHSRGSAVPIEVEHDFLGGVLNKAFSCGGSSRAVPSQVERGMLGGVMNAVGLRWSSRRGGFVFNQANIFPREIFLLQFLLVAGERLWFANVCVASTDLAGAWRQAAGHNGIEFPV